MAMEGERETEREREIYIYYIHHMFGIFGSNMLIFEMISFWILAIKWGLQSPPSSPSFKVRCRTAGRHSMVNRQRFPKSLGFLSHIIQVMDDQSTSYVSTCFKAWWLGIPHDLSDPHLNGHVWHISFSLRLGSKSGLLPAEAAERAAWPPWRSRNDTNCWRAAICNLENMNNGRSKSQLLVGSWWMNGCSWCTCAITCVTKNRTQ